MTIKLDGKPVPGSEAIGFIVTSFLLSLLSLCARAAVFVKLWQWFVVPAAAGRLPIVGFWHAAGLLVFLAFLRFEYKPDEATGVPWERVINSTFSSLIMSGLALTVGWLVMAVL